MTSALCDFAAEKFDLAQEIVREAGALALGYYKDTGALTITDKGVNDMVSNADVETEKFLRARFAEAWPEDAFLGEESGGARPAPDQGVWVVDPIDGTACFVKGIPSWTVSVAYFRSGRIEFGFVFDPVHDEFYAARRGGGATMNGDPIHCASDTDFTRALTGIGVSHRVPPAVVAGVIERLLSAGGVFLRTGSGALGLAYVACGRLNAYYEAHINSWDALAGFLLVREAGGWTNDFLTDDTLIDGAMIAVSAPALGPQLLEIIGAE